MGMGCTQSVPVAMVGAEESELEIEMNNFSTRSATGQRVADCGLGLRTRSTAHGQGNRRAVRRCSVVEMRNQSVGKMKKQTEKAQVSRPIDGLVLLSVVERLEAAERYYRQHDVRFADGLRHAAEIAAPDGWRHIAPAWMKPNISGQPRLARKEP